MPMLTEALSDATVYQLTMAGCPPIIGFELAVPAQSKFCSEFNQRVLKKILDLKSQGLEGVVLSARWPSHFWHKSIAVLEPQDSPMGDPNKIAQARVEMQDSLDAMLGVLENAGIRVMVLAPTPELVYLAPSCIGLRRGEHCNVPRAMNKTMIEESTAALQEVINRHANARLLELMDYFCDAQTCFAERGGKILYTDDDHVTATAARDLGHTLAADLAWLIGKP